ncbi:hypothetical protein TTHERM_000444609 (macronuclear) [Tetrahymena thermophila SB210]|uniref:Transmembrane protein n=1 Tax=Tetrahymena thermophila (strain SB210) TaxID=312017 RepID=W7XEN2_TETTS|nr:hypothetical protein TTHERM_000444609 [Tetrahymena thermophila SB210]EWS72341.1 hypothetical protein TTHERM_000444609 [Tetrahymena thermophila SB210]|eukprot:XP_012655118.1 hypothetical protein TTHERM_000444609 [Tetrahymena thermophila SB210]
MKIIIFLLIAILFSINRAQQYTVDINQAYVDCITGCLVQEQTCNNLADCSSQKAQYQKCSLSNRNYCLISTPYQCNKVCVTFTPTAEFQSYLQCRLRCYLQNLSISILWIIMINLVIQNL